MWHEAVDQTDYQGAVLGLSAAEKNAIGQTQGTDDLPEGPWFNTVHAGLLLGKTDMYLCISILNNGDTTVLHWTINMIQDIAEHHIEYHHVLHNTVSS